MKFTSVAGLLALGLVLSGCATLPEIPYDRQTAGEIKTIGVLTPRFPDDAHVVLATTVGQSFGLIGALVDAGMQAERDNAFEAMLKPAHFSAHDEFMARLTHGLEAEGYTLSTVDVPRPKTDFLKPYPTGHAVDAYLDVVVLGYGYIAAGIGDATPYRPYFSLKVRLVRASDSAVLMQDVVVYNPYNIQGGAQGAHAVTVSPDPQYVFVDFKTFKANPDRAIKGMQDAVDKSADAAAALLR
jgi:hypothetical protein